MVRLPKDEELYAQLPGTGTVPDSLYGTMDELYREKLVRVKSSTAAGCTGLSEDCIHRRQQDAMGRWLQGYLRQRRPIVAYPEGCTAPGMTETVGDAVRELRRTRRRVEETRPRYIILKLLETGILYVVTQLLWQGVLAWEAYDLDITAHTAPENLLAFTVSMWMMAGLTVAYVSFVASAGGVLIMLVRLADRQRVKEEFLISVNDNMHSAYLYLRFCQLWCTAQRQKLPEDLSFGLKEVNKAVRLYNSITEAPSA